MIKRSTIVVIAICLLYPHLAFSYTYEKTIDLPPIKLTYDDVNQIIEALRTQIPGYINSQKSSYYDESISIAGDDLTVKKTGAFRFEKNDRLPEISRSLYYTYHNRDGLIEDISMHLGDIIRTITIYGSSPDHVDALLAFLTEKFKSKTIIMGGGTFRRWSGLFLFIVGTCLWSLGMTLSKFPMFSRIAFAICGVAIEISVFILPYDQWLPGCAIYKDSASTLVRYSAQITFLGVILSILFFIATIIISYKLSKRNSLQGKDNHQN